VNEQNLRKLYERLGIGESPPPSPPRPLPVPEAPLYIESPPVAEPVRPDFPPPEGMISSTPLRTPARKVVLSIPLLVISLGAIAFGLLLVTRSGGSSAEPKAPVVVAPRTPPPVVDPPVPPPTIPEPATPAIPDPPDPIPPPPPLAPPPPELTPEQKRAERIRAQGGTDETEKALGLALDWLARHQSEDGSWDAQDFVLRCTNLGNCLDSDAKGDKYYTPGVTGLALLAFLGAGHGPDSQTHGRTVSMGLKWLVENQESDGSIRYRKNKWILFYNQAVATRALCEATRATGDTRFRSAAQKAIDFLGRSQNADGGWDYFQKTKDEERNDASIAGWVGFAVRAGEAAGLKIPDSMKERILDLFNRRTTVDTGEVIYADRNPGAGRRGAGLVALGLYVRGWGQANPVVTSRATSRLLAARPDWDAYYAAQGRIKEIKFHPDHNFAAWYYGAEAAWGLGGTTWSSWNDRMRPVLVDHQVREGHSAGSWVPELGYIGREGGRVFSTAVAALMLTMYARER
jgi:hypothetical protein